MNACISLGPVYIKLGQWLSSRSDILPEPYMKELQELQDNVPSVPFDKIKPIIENDLGPLEKNFDFIDQNVLSGASLGQVYRAKIGGAEVVVKVKRPGIEKRVEDDLKVLKKFLPMGLKFIDDNLGFSANSIMTQFTETIHDEMDYTLESSNLKNIKKNLMTNDHVVIPSVYDEYSSKNVITMEYIPGIKITNIEALDEKGFDREKLIMNVCDIFFTMLLRYPIFHADPHPGNISVNQDGKLILYDYGMTGKLDRETRLLLVRLYLGLIERDSKRTVNVMDELGMLKPGFNRNLIEKAMTMSMGTMNGTKPNDMEFQSFTELTNKTMGKFPFILPKELALYLRTTSIIEGIYHTHKLNFNFARVLRDILEKENLITDASIEELNNSINRFLDLIYISMSIAPQLKNFLDENKSLQVLQKKQKCNTLLSGSILSSAIFLGSAFLFTSNESVGIIGMIGSVILISVFAKFLNY